MYNTQDYYFVGTIRAAAILTGSYVAATTITPNDNCQRFNQLILYIDFTKGSLTDCDIKVEFSHDNSAFYQETFSSISGDTSTETAGIHTIAATGKFRIAIPIKDNYIKVSAIGNGTTTNSSLKIDAVLGVQ